MADSTVRFDERAERDAEAAVEWYDGQRAGLGNEFLEALDETVASISQHPRMYPEIESNIRRALTNRFPYSVYYRPGDDEIVVLAVLHTRRAPDELEERTDE